MIEISPGGSSQASAHMNSLRVPIYCAGQVRGRLLLVCGALGLRPDGAIINYLSFFVRET